MDTELSGDLSKNNGGTGAPPSPPTETQGTNVSSLSPLATERVQAWKTASTVIALLEDGNMNAALTYLPFLNVTAEAATTLGALILYDLYQRRYWRSQREFADFCERHFHRSVKTCYELIANVKFFLEELGQDRRSFYAASVRVGWTRLAELRRAPTGSVTPDTLDTHLAAMAHGQTRRAIRQRLRQTHDTPHQTHDTPHQTHDTPHPTRLFSVVLPPHTYTSLLDAIADAKTRWRLTTEAQAVDAILAAYWQSAVRETQPS